MNCQNHPESPATVFCRQCGRPLCDACRRDVFGTVFCQEHAPAPAPPPGPGAPYRDQGAPQPRAVHADVSPGLALGLGFIPGVGAIYNGQYAKGLVHAVIFGVLISILDSNATGGLEPLFGIMLSVLVFYMAFEAYHTARKRRAGEVVDEFSSLIQLRAHPEQLPVAGVVLILLGVALLLNTLGFLDFHYLARYWPVLLIVLGAYLLYVRLAAGTRNEEATHERQ